jgi:hypothetical protein
MRNKLFAPASFVPRVAAGDIGLYSAVTLLDVLFSPENAPELNQFWMKFFPRSINFTTEKIMFDEIDNNEYRLAPFVAPNVQGRVIAAKGFTTRSFRPAYVKPKHVIDPARTIPRRAGEMSTMVGGGMSLQQKFDLIMADNLRRERAMIENRWDWMACKAIVDGKVTVSGEDYPTTTVDFGRDPALTTTLTGGALWTASTATPMADIQAKRTLAFKLSRAPVNTLIFGIDAWTAFVQEDHPDVQTLLNVLRRGGESVFNAPNISDGSPYNYQGFISGANTGRLELWTYSNYYESDGTDGNAAGMGINYLDPSYVVGVGGAINGVACYGAIMDRRAQLQPLSMFPKVWDEEDPSVTYSMTQSAPLMVPIRPNNTFRLKVV